MPTLTGRLGAWDLDHVHAWKDRAEVLRAEPVQLIDSTTTVATIGSCFASELAKAMRTVGVKGGMHPGGLFYSTATIRQELERIVGGWPERASEQPWPVGGGVVDPFRDYDTIYEDAAALDAARATADAAAAELFTGARVVLVTVGLVETWRNPSTGNTYRQIPHPAHFKELGAEFHRLTVSEMLADLERIRTIICERLGAEFILTTSPVPIHTTFTGLDVRVANIETKSRIRAAVSEFVDLHPDVHYFHSYDMVVTAERQSDYYRDDGRHVHAHAVRYIVAEFLRQYGDPSVQMSDVDSSWLTPITKTAATPSPEVRPRPAGRPKAPPPSFGRRAVRGIRRRVGAALGSVASR